MNILYWTIITGAISLLPLIALSYLCLRFTERKNQLVSLFTLEGILKAYLSARGRNVKPLKKETHEKLIRRLKTEFEEMFKTELSQEYGTLRFLIAIVIGTVSSAIVVIFWATWSFPGSLNIKPEMPHVPVIFTPVDFALVGAYTWTIWLLLKGYESLDLTPSEFYWIPFRYIVAVVAGMLAGIIFNKETGLAMVFAFIATAIPYPEFIKFLKKKIPLLSSSEAGDPPLNKLQGVSESTLDRLDKYGIHTTQELAYCDPLMLLFRSNFPPKVLIDLMDQALLYNYIGDKLSQLRPRGIRGAIEFIAIQHSPHLIVETAKVLETKECEITHLCEQLDYDYQAQLIWKIWDEFRP